MLIQCSKIGPEATIRDTKSTSIRPAVDGYVNGTNNTTAIGPALVNGTLANVSRTTGQICLHHYIG